MNYSNKKYPKKIQKLTKSQKTMRNLNNKLSKLRMMFGINNSKWMIWWRKSKLWEMICVRKRKIARWLRRKWMIKKKSIIKSNCNGNWFKRCLKNKQMIKRCLYRSKRKKYNKKNLNFKKNYSKMMKKWINLKEEWGKMMKSSLKHYKVKKVNCRSSLNKKKL